MSILTEIEEELFAKGALVYLTSSADATVPRIVVEIGPGRTPWFDFVTANAGNKRAWEDFAAKTAAVLSSEYRDSASNRQMLDQAYKRLKGHISRSNIPPELKGRLLDDLAIGEREYITPLEALQKDGADAQARLASRSPGPRIIGTSMKSFIQTATDNQVALLARSMRDTLGKLRAARRALTGTESLLLQAYRKVNKAIGEQGWQVIYEYLASLTPGQRNLIKQVAAAAEKLESNKAAAIARGQLDTAQKLEQGSEDLFARINQQVRNKLKGLVNEVYTSTWTEWTTIRAQRLDEAVRFAGNLPPLGGATGWDVMLLSGATGSPIRLDGREIWDEAILIVERGTSGKMPRAILFNAAQLKAERDVSAIAQTIGDITDRERPGAILDWVDDKGVQHAFTLYKPLSPDFEPQRWVLNAIGSRYSIGELQETYRRYVNLNIFAHDLSVQEFNALCNTLLVSAAKNF